MNMPAGFQTVLDTFKKNGWNFQAVEGQPFLNAHFSGCHGTFRLTLAVDEPDDLVQIFGFVPLLVPPHMLPAISELCIRLSWNLKLGRFELDHARGQLRFHLSSAYRPGDLSENVVGRLVGLSLLMVDQHFPAFVAVLYVGQSPQQAAEQVRARLVNGKSGASSLETQPPARTSLN
jgi:hypothetical protein